MKSAMFKKSISLSSLLLIMSVVPAWAQYSFEKVIGGREDDRPCGMTQASDGYFYLYGTYGSYSSFGGNQNYVAKIDHLGNVIWEKTYVNKSVSDQLEDMIELPNGNLLFGGIAQEQLQSLNARASIFTKEGQLLFDTLYPQVHPQCGSIQSITHNKSTQQLVTIGGGCLNNDAPGLLFQTLDYNGRRTGYTMLPYPEEFRTKKIFKLKGQNNYVVFGKNRSLHLDNVGNLIESPLWAIDTSGGFADEILDIVQLNDGTFCGLLAPWNISIGSYKLQYFDSLGKFQRIGNLVLKSSVFLRKLTCTTNKGFFIAGSDFILVDSNEQIVWQKTSTQPTQAETVSIGEASDGGFYGSATDWTKNNSLDPDIYVFKTSEDGVISGIGDYEKAKLSVQISPNPSKGFIILSGAFSLADLKVTNLLGQQIFTSQKIAPNTEIDIKTLNDGIYFISVSSQKASYVQKIIIAK